MSIGRTTRKYTEGEDTFRLKPAPTTPRSEVLPPPPANKRARVPMKTFYWKTATQRGEVQARNITSATTKKVAQLLASWYTNESIVRIEIIVKDKPFTD